MRRFQFVISLGGASVAVRVVEARSDQHAHELAARVLAESRQHRAVAVWEGDAELFALSQPAAAAA
jgi:hypothetical protein